MSITDFFAITISTVVSIGLKSQRPYSDVSFSKSSFLSDIKIMVGSRNLYTQMISQFLEEYILKFSASRSLTHPPQL